MRKREGEEKLRTKKQETEKKGKEKTPPPKSIDYGGWGHPTLFYPDDRVDGF